MCPRTVEANIDAIINGNPLRMILFALEAVVVRSVLPIYLRSTRARSLQTINKNTLRAPIFLKIVSLGMNFSNLELA